MHQSRKQLRRHRHGPQKKRKGWQKPALQPQRQLSLLQKVECGFSDKTGISCCGKHDSD